MTQPEIRIRLAGASDIAAAGALHVESCLDIYRGLIPETALRETLPRNLARVWAEETLPGGDFLLIAEAEGAICGMVTLRDRPVPYVDHFHVRPTMKGRGIGRMLMAALFAEMRARGMREMELDVATGNDAALAFYVAMGGAPGEAITGDLFGLPVPALVVRWADIGAAPV